MFLSRNGVWRSSHSAWRLHTQPQHLWQQSPTSASTWLSTSLVPVPTSQHGAVPTSVPRDLQQAKFIFSRRDAHRTPLQHPYEGLIKVIQPGSKTFQIDIGGKTETISVDRLKPAHIDLELPAQVAMPRPRGRPPKNSNPHPQLWPNTKP